MANVSGQIGVIVVDIQGDFTEVKEGSLPVPGTDKTYIETVDKAVRRMKEAGFKLFATQDWHPADHVSFFTNHPGKKPFEEIELEDRSQILWPPHCVQGTEAARFLIENNLFLAFIQKGLDRKFESYSAFRDDGDQSTGLASILKQHGIEKIVVFGIATDYCVSATATDGIQAGFTVIVIKDLCRGVDPESSIEVLDRMKKAGITLIDSNDIYTIEDL